MKSSVVALFGEAEKGLLDTVYFCPTLRELFEHLGQPPANTCGLYYAVQALLYDLPVIYLKVREEGASLEDYFSGFRLLRNSNSPVLSLQALFLPGVGSSNVLDEGVNLCLERHSVLIVNESDFYDYMTQSLAAT